MELCGIGDAEWNISNRRGYYETMENETTKKVKNTNRVLELLSIPEADYLCFGRFFMAIFSGK